MFGFCYTKGYRLVCSLQIQLFYQAPWFLRTKISSLCKQLLHQSQCFLPPLPSIGVQTSSGWWAMLVYHAWSILYSNWSFSFALSWLEHPSFCIFSYSKRKTKRICKLPLNSLQLLTTPCFLVNVGSWLLPFQHCNSVIPVQYLLDLLDLLEKL